MQPKQKAQDLINKFKPHVYCYMGSGVLTNDYNETVALNEAKNCALMCAKVVLESTPLNPSMNEKEDGINMHSEDFWEDVVLWLNRSISDIFDEHGN